MISYQKRIPLFFLSEGKNQLKSNLDFLFCKAFSISSKSNRCFAVSNISSEVNHLCSDLGSLIRYLFLFLDHIIRGSPSLTINVGKFIPVNYKLVEIPEDRIDGRIFKKGFRWADADEIDFKKKIRKIRKKRVKLIKPGPTPKASNKMPKLDADDKKALAKINRNKQLAKQYNKRNKNVFTRLISKFNKGYGRPKGGVTGNKTT